MPKERDSYTIALLAQAKRIESTVYLVIQHIASLIPKAHKVKNLELAGSNLSCLCHIFMVIWWLNDLGLERLFM